MINEHAPSRNVVQGIGTLTQEDVSNVKRICILQILRNIVSNNDVRLMKKLTGMESVFHVVNIKLLQMMLDHAF